MNATIMRIGEHIAVNACICIKRTSGKELGNSILAKSALTVVHKYYSPKYLSQQPYIRHNIHSDTNITGMERAVITILAPSGSSSHCVKPHRRARDKM